VKCNACNIADESQVAAFWVYVIQVCRMLVVNWPSY
jgi:hypothetical protein